MASYHRPPDFSNTVCRTRRHTGPDGGSTRRIRVARERDDPRDDQQQRQQFRGALHSDRPGHARAAKRLRRPLPNRYGKARSIPARHGTIRDMSTAPRLAAAKRDWGHDETGCTVLHIDMDAFYASLEVARHPELKGKPVIIGTGTRSVVSAASYEARRYGVNSAMASARARQLCPDGVFLPVDMHYYRMMSRRIVEEVFSQVTDRFEQVSVDEAYMDVSGALLAWQRPTRIGAWIRQEVASRFHVTCSVGVAANKLVAKMASTNAKPDGMLLIPVARHAEFVQMMPLRGIPGIGPSLERRLAEWGVKTVADLAKMSEQTLATAIGSGMRPAAPVLRRSGELATQTRSGGADGDGETAVRRSELQVDVTHHGTRRGHGRRAVSAIRRATVPDAGDRGWRRRHAEPRHSPAARHPARRHERERIGEVGWFDRAADVG